MYVPRVGLPSDTQHESTDRQELNSNFWFWSRNENVVIAERSGGEFKICIESHKYDTLPITIASMETKHHSQIWACQTHQQLQTILVAHYSTL